MKREEAELEAGPFANITHHHIVAGVDGVELSWGQEIGNSRIQYKLVQRGGEGRKENKLNPRPIVV